MPSDLDLLIDAARSAGDIARGYFNASPEVWDKSDGQGPVTEADLHVNRQLLADLRGARPDYGWLSEESEDTETRLKTDRQFIIDPIDGTRSFIEGNKDWAHSIAITQDGVPVAGVIYLPIRDRLYAAELGKGATCNGVPIRAAQDKAMEDTTVLTARPSLAAQHWVAEVPPFKRTFRSSLAYRLALVAEGRFDAMLTLRPTWEWDVAAGALIVGEAGGNATDQKGGAARFNNPHPQINGMVAAGGTHADLIHALA